MTEDPPRYHPNRDGGMCKAEKGDWVRYEEYAAIKTGYANFLALAARNEMRETMRSVERAIEEERRSLSKT